jgi:hypothetical protein
MDGLMDDLEFYHKEARKMAPMPERLTQGEAKPTNPKDIVATTKLPLHLVPMITQAYLAIGHFNGLGKYGRDNWRACGVLASVYVSAALRHINSWNEGEELDPDDGVPHLMGAITSLSILIDAQYTQTLTDDRKYRGAGIPEQTRGLAEAHVARLMKLHSKRVPRHYNIQDNYAQENIRDAQEKASPDRRAFCDSAEGKGTEQWRPVEVIAAPGEFRTARG